MLEHRNYLKVAEGNLELIRADIWDIEITAWPSAVYNPGIDLLKVRLKDVDPGSGSEPVLLEKEVLGHTILSPGGRKGQPTSVTLNFVDREDQAITYMVMDYKNQLGDADTGFTRHKSELKFEMNIIYYNTLLKPYKRIEYYNGLYETSTLPRELGEAGSDNSEVALTIKFQHHKEFPID